jgi:hypothetical protein
MTINKETNGTNQGGRANTLATSGTARRTFAFRRCDPSEVGRPQHRVKNPVFTNSTEGDMYTFRQKFWDVYEAIQGALLTSVTLFTIPKGQQFTPVGGATAYTKTLYHTNFKLASLIGQPNKAYIMSLGWGARTNIAPIDAVHMFWDPYVLLTIDDHPYVAVTAEHLPYGQGISSGSSAFTNNGWAFADNAYLTLGQKGETIEQAQSIAVMIDPTLMIDNAGNTTYTLATTANGGVGVDAKCFMDTQYYRTLGT